MPDESSQLKLINLTQISVAVNDSVIVWLGGGGGGGPFRGPI